MSSSSSLVSWFASFGIWNWFILAGVLFGLEILAPGTFMLWFGIAAVVVGLISIFVDWTWQLQLIAFGLLSLVSILAWRRLGSRVEPVADRPFLNRRAEAFVGRVFTLEKPIVDGSGTLRIDDTVWRIMGPDIPAGSRVRIASADGTTLRVDRAEA
jgi:membrane protein implicated in regulation of membrane protease activity